MPHTELHVGEKMIDRPASSRCAMHGVGGQPKGTLYLTNLRLLWEPAVASEGDGTREEEPSSSAAASASASAARTLSVPLHSIERLRQLKLKAASSSFPCARLFMLSLMRRRIDLMSSTCEMRSCE